MNANKIPTIKGVVTFRDKVMQPREAIRYGHIKYAADIEKAHADVVRMSGIKPRDVAEIDEEQAKWNETRKMGGV